jgi:PHD/YefM family antitoxin component YafN of YafNO toxin-antitoxin module
MNNLTKEINYETLTEDFSHICEHVNSGTDAVALNLKSGRKVYIMPEENFNHISKFVMFNASPSALTL